MQLAPGLQTPSVSCSLFAWTIFTDSDAGMHKGTPRYADDRMCQSTLTADCVAVQTSQLTCMDDDLDAGLPVRWLCDVHAASKPMDAMAHTLSRCTPKDQHPVGLLFASSTSTTSALLSMVGSWAALYNTWLLIKLLLKGVVFPFSFLVNVGFKP